MIGGERLDVEHRFQLLTGGPEITLTNFDGTFVEGSNGQMCQLQDSFGNNEHEPGSREEVEELKQYFAASIGAAEAEKLMNRDKKNRQKYLEWGGSGDRSKNYYPAGGLPEDSVLVVRTSVLREFERVAGTEKCSADKADALGASERTTVLKIIGGFAMEAYRMNIHAERLEGIGEMVKDLERAGASVTDKTLRQWIKEAAGIIRGRKPTP